jgi:putative selenate reductase molybdopterin-binding subunit
MFNSKGRVINPSLHSYHIFSLRDKPEIKSILVKSYEKSGPYGAKSIGEIGINGPAPAIANAIYNAVGIRLRSLPFTPEKIWQTMVQQ